MNDLNIARLIHFVGVGGTLVSVSGCNGCDDESKRIAHQASSQEVFELSCETQKNCDVVMFARRYISLDDCLEYYTSYSSDVEAGYGVDCALADLAVHECRLKALTKTCSTEKSNKACPSAQKAFDDNCKL